MDLKEVTEVIKNADVFVSYDSGTDVDDAIELAIMATKRSIITDMEDRFLFEERKGINGMTLEEGIKQCEEIADYDCYNEKQMKRAEEYRQLAEWLKELKSFREAKEDIQRTIDETRENGKYHAQFIQDNGELMIFGMEIALDIIKEHSSCSESKKGHMKTIKDLLDLFEPYLTAEDLQECLDELKKTDEVI